jgi:hypothetical protein
VHLWQLSVFTGSSKSSGTAENKMENSRRVSSGVSGLYVIGTSLAMVISYTANHSVGWAVLHGIGGWIYVIYRLAIGIPLS